MKHELIGPVQDIVWADDRAEREAMGRLSNRAIEASSPSAFDHTGYPTRVTDERALWRYADVMQDGRARKTYELLGGLTEREFELLKQVTLRAATMTAVRCSRQIVPRDAPMRALLAYRQIAAFYPSRSRVFEVGPGSGYLGAMLDADGYDYRSTDITQAFHLWQTMLLGDDFREIQMPWWDWIDIRRPDFEVDVITVNHALNEMQLRALQYLIVRAERMLPSSGALFVESWGAEYHRSTQQTAKLFDQRGWHASTQGVCDVLVPPHFVAPPREKQPLGDLTRGWDDIQKMWTDLGAAPTPDEEFATFCGLARDG